MHRWWKENETEIMKREKREQTKNGKSENATVTGTTEERKKIKELWEISVEDIEQSNKGEI